VSPEKLSEAREMVRKLRFDADGEVFHVFNRGTARRTICEKPRDWRYFESRMAHAVRRRQIVILAFCLLHNHFHLLIRSRARMPQAMRSIQREHAVYFNRSRERTGPLLTGRYKSVLVTSSIGLENTYFYVDENALDVEGIDHPVQWPWCSAHLFATGRPPRWLSPELMTALGVTYGPSGTALAAPEVRAARRELVEARMSRSYVGADPLDEVLSGVPDRVWAWMLATANLADGTKAGIPVAGAATVQAAVATLGAELAARPLHLPHARAQPFACLLLVGLLRDAASSTFEEIARIVNLSHSAVRRLHGLHVRGLQEDATYGEAARSLIDACVAPLRRPRRA